MEYKLLDIGVGVILTRQPEILSGEISVSFVNAPEGATAIFEEKAGDSFYRELSSDGTCSLPPSISGEVRVSVAVFSGVARPKRWICEEFKVCKEQNGCILVAPNDMNLPQTVVELRLENEAIREELKNTNEKYNKLYEALEKIMEGYDLT